LGARFHPQTEQAAGRRVEGPFRRWAALCPWTTVSPHMRSRLTAALLCVLPSLAFAANDARCQGTPKARAARFSEAAMKGAPAAERYAAYVQACALDEVVELTKQLVRFKTVSSEV